MKEIFHIEDTPGNKISYFFLLAFLVFLPFDRIFSELALAGLVLHTLIQAVGHKRMGRMGSGGWLLLSLYILTMAGTLYTRQPEQAWKEWEKQLAFLFFPLICCFNGLDWTKYRLPLLKAFSYTCLFVIIYLYAAALLAIQTHHLPFSALFSPLFLNHAFSAPIDLHATYLSMYTALSLVTFAWLFLRAGSPATRLLYLLCVLVLSAGILQLASRAVFMAVILTMNIIIPFFLLPARKRWKYLLLSILLSLLAIWFLSGNGSFRSRYIAQVRQDLGTEGLYDRGPDWKVRGYVGGVEPRLLRWECAWELIRASPWIGYGSGMEKTLLKEEYYRHHLYLSYKNELDAHNQYLSFLLKTGIPGLMLYLLLLGAGLWQAFRQKDPWMAAFLLIIIIVSFSENILDTNKGIFFTSFFFPFFFQTVRKPVFSSQYGDKNILPLVGT